MSSTAVFRPETEIAGAGLAKAGPSSLATSLGTVSLRVTRDLESLKALWESMQRATPCTSAQTYDWAEAWTAHVLAPRGDTPVIVVGYGPDGTPLFLWPFEMGTRAGLKILKWLGQDHANYTMGLFAPDAARGFTRTDMSRLVHEAGRQSGAAAATLEAQPFAWDGQPNPFALMSHQRAPNSGYAVKLGDFTALYDKRFSKRSRQTLNRKERRLRDMGALDYGWAETPAKKRELLETFFAQKTRQFASMGVENIFGPQEQGFYQALAMLPDGSPCHLRLGYVALDGDVLATFSGALCHDRIGVMLSSLTENDAQRQSPGALLLRHQIKEACASGVAFFDLGVGQARHKDEWSNTVYTLFDSFIAFKPQGLVLTVPLAGVARLKRAIKSNRHLWAFAQDLRKRLKGH
jgi:CelD/BcsL family acetyltransferase involved in cellulose biosynthesis